MAYYEIINHGWDNCQYFPGCGTAYTSFNHVVTGIGDNAKAAYEDALNMLYQSEDIDLVAKLHLPMHPRGIRATDIVPKDADEDCYWYVSIRYTL